MMANSAFEFQILVLLWCLPTYIASSDGSCCDCKESKVIYVYVAAVLFGLSVLVTIGNIIYWVRRLRQIKSIKAVLSKTEDQNPKDIKYKSEALTNSKSTLGLDQSGKYIYFQESYDVVGQRNSSTTCWPSQQNIYESIDQSNAPVVLAPPPPEAQTPHDRKDKLKDKSDFEQTYETPAPSRNPVAQAK